MSRARRNAQTGLVGLTFFTLFAPDAWQNLVGWWGYLAIAGVLVVVWLIIVLRQRRTLYWRSLPASLVAFLIWAGMSISWSPYPAESGLWWAATLATGFVAFAIVLTTDRAGLVRGLGFALRWILALSIVFEAVVALFVRQPVLPLWVSWGAEKIPSAFYWSQAKLLSLGPIQGIVGNGNLLGFIALLALIIFCVQLSDRAVWRGSGVLWIIIAAGTILLTRSSTVWVALVVVAVVAGLALWTRALAPSRRWPAYTTAWLGGIGLLATVSLWWNLVTSALGHSSDATGQGNLWNDVWLPVGIIGAVLLALAALMGLWRAWFLAVDRPRWDLESSRPFTAHALMPLLLIVALLAQSVWETRIVVDGGFALLVAILCAVKMPARGVGERR